MIAACPRCGARYRIDAGRIGPEGARLRCARCEAVFRVRTSEPAGAAGDAGSAAPRAEAREAKAAAPAPAGPAAASAPAYDPAPPGPEAEPPSDRAHLVLVADAEVESGKAVVDALLAQGLRPLLVHDGVEAILSVQRLLPAAVILDAALPKMYGFQVCELMKRNEYLRHIPVVLVGAIHHRNRYRRPPSELYGADAYLERPQLAEELEPTLRRLGLGVSAPPAPPARAAEPGARAAGEPAASAVASREAAGAPAAAEPSAGRGPAPAASDGLDEERAKAERLARIIVSDIVLYNDEKFAEAAAAGTVRAVFDDLLEEGRALMRQRVDPRIREERDFLQDELLRVARERGNG